MVKQTTTATTDSTGVLDQLDQARRASAQAVNSVMTATYWHIGRRLAGAEAADDTGIDVRVLASRLAGDLTAQFGRGFGGLGLQNLIQMRAFYAAYKDREPTEPQHSTWQPIGAAPAAFPLPWSHYVQLLAVKPTARRDFYEREAVRRGWTLQQLRQRIAEHFYERAAARQWMNGGTAGPADSGEGAHAETTDAMVRDPHVLAFLGLKDEYAGDELKAALLHHLESVLLGLGNDFAVAGRYRRMPLSGNLRRVADLVLFHRRLRSLVIVDLDAAGTEDGSGEQVYLACQYAHDNWSCPGENTPVGLIVRLAEGGPLVRYALDFLPSETIATEYGTVLPDLTFLTAEVERVQQALAARSTGDK